VTDLAFNNQACIVHIKAPSLENLQILCCERFCDCPSLQLAFIAPALQKSLKFCFCSTAVRKPIYTSSPPNDRWLNYTDLDLSYITGGLKVTWGRDLSLKGRDKCLSDCSFAYTDKQFAFCEPVCELSVNCTCSIKVSGESLEVVL
jgi:hypothetical protein